MSRIKIVIALEESLFQQIELVRQELKISRSHFIALIAEEYLQKHQNRQLVEAINVAYAEPPDEEEQKTISAIKHYVQNVLDPWE